MASRGSSFSHKQKRANNFSYILKGTTWLVSNVIIYCLSKLSSAGLSRSSYFVYILVFIADPVLSVCIDVSKAK